MFVDKRVYLLSGVAVGLLDDPGDDKALSRFYRVLKHTSLPPVCCIKLRSVFCDVCGVIHYLSRARLCQWASQFPITPPLLRKVPRAAGPPHSSNFGAVQSRDFYFILTRDCFSFLIPPFERPVFWAWPSPATAVNSDRQAPWALDVAMLFTADDHIVFLFCLLLWTLNRSNRSIIGILNWSLFVQYWKNNIQSAHWHV